eukprot:TRINITY_DN11417_c0_g1_i1.p1 TRINITY_DN11417_c0_g1~~TRINITY_DN11417_c0_g1_i1.p1  ORF type:complete len:214 (+),score=42.73 TRINITY_DN11417_c0_g1_i1:52-642(+)
MSSEPHQPSAGVLKFLLLVGKIKRVKRTGWVNNRIEDPESVADHMYRMGLLSFLIKDPAIDRERCMKLAIVHDLAECIVGDITPHDGVTKEDKYELEMNAMQDIANSLGSDYVDLGTELKELWLEYETASSKEAKVVKDLDKFEMLMQAYEYELEQNVPLDQFFDGVDDKKMTSSEVKGWSADLRKIREQNGNRLN